MLGEVKIAIGIITCMRPLGLQKLLESLAGQAESVNIPCRLTAIVVDNDMTGKNREIVEDVRRRTGLDIIFAEESERGIPSARNASVRLALAHDFDAMVFVDDDEYTPAGWLAALVEQWRSGDADIVTGPVKGILPLESPSWAYKSGAYNKIPPYVAGQYLEKAFTNNTLASRQALEIMGASFSAKFQQSGSSDLHYFREAIRKGLKIAWAPTAIIHENVPLSRVRIGWVIRRGFRTGAGDTMSRLLIQPGFRTVMHIIFISMVRIMAGVTQLFLSPFGRWRYVIVGIKRISSGLGGFLGLFGVTYKEYKIIHGS